MSTHSHDLPIQHERVLIVSLHDLHPKSLNLIQKQVDFLEKPGVQRVSILAIPQYHHGARLDEDASTLRWLDERAQMGDDIVLHGYFHDRVGQRAGNLFYTRFYTANEAEFLNLPDDECARRIEEGCVIWRARNWPLHGFIAPAWLMPVRQHAILRRLGFSYTTHLRTIELLQQNRSIDAQSLCYSTRANWRVFASKLWNGALHAKLRSQHVMRLSLHPRDLEFAAIRRQIEKMVRSAIDDGRKVVSYAEYAAWATCAPSL